MPAKNSIKYYIENGYYHVYNRGVEKRIIFKEDIDYKVFLSFLKEYLSPKTDLIYNFEAKQGDSLYKKNRHKNYFGKIELLSYALLPNHFHFLIKQLLKDSMEKFMRSLATRYSMYFNKKYKRIGSLFQSNYKAVQILDDSYLLHLSRYIHLNPLEYIKDISKAYSSYADYLGLKNTKWIKPEFVLSYFNSKVSTDFKKVNTYRNFVEGTIYDNSDSLRDLNLTLE